MIIIAVFCLVYLCLYMLYKCTVSTIFEGIKFYDFIQKQLLYFSLKERIVREVKQSKIGIVII